jgi:prophage antirepressor-like protein
MSENNKLRIFENEEFGFIRTITKEDKVLFCASDVAKALGYSNPSKAIGDHCRYLTKCYVPHPQSPDKEIEMTFIPEGDVYRLIVRSKLPSAQKFESWVFDEVLPDIRKHGMYLTDPLAAMLEDDADEDKFLEVAQKYVAEKKRRKALEKEVERLEGEVEYKEDVIVGLVDDIDLATKRQRINQIIRHGVTKSENYQKRWAMFYTEFEKKYHMNLSMRFENHKKDFRPQLKNKIDYIERGLKMVPQAYEVCCKLFENDVEELMKEWRVCVEDI